MRFRTGRTLLALTCAASLSACSDEKPQPQQPVDEYPPTVPYDGPYTPLPENGDWVDRGAFSACSAREVLTTSDFACGDEASFDLSSCDGDSLATMERQSAIYRAELRYEFNTGVVPGAAGFLFDAAGQPVSVRGMTPSRGHVDARTFVLSGESRVNPSTTQRLTLAGCRAPNPRELTGCFSVCANGRVSHRGTFRAERMTWRAGETESSGGLQLRSESFVDLGVPVDVYVTKGHAYVVSVDGSGRTGGLTVFDVSDPRNPVQRTVITFPNDTYWNGVWAKGDALYVASGDAGLLVYDITTPASPVRVRNLPGGALDVHTVFVEGDRLYAMSSGNRETLIFDVSTPLAPRLLNRFALPEPEGAPHDAFAYQGRLYLNHLSDGFAVLDVSTPEDVKLLGRYTYPYMFSHATAVGTFNGRTLAFEGGETLGAHLRVLDVTHPAGIAKIGEYQLRNLTSIHNMVLVGTRLYVAYYHEGVRVLDVSDPARPTEIAYFNTFRETDPRRSDGMYDGAIGMRVPGDGNVYVVDTARGLLIFNEP